MGSNPDWLERARQRRKEEEEKNKSNNTNSTNNTDNTSTEPDWLERARQRRFDEDVKKVDSSYIKLFEDAANWFYNSAEEDYGKVDFSSASSIYRIKRDSLKDLEYRRSVIQKWMESNRDKFDADSYQSYYDSLESFGTNASGILSNFANARDFYSQFKTEDDYLAYKDHEEKSKFDIKKGQSEIAHLENVLEDYKMLTRFTTDEKGARRAAQIRQQYGDEKAIKALISQKKQYLNQAKHIQDGITLSSVSGNSDFKQKSGYVSTFDDGVWSKLTSDFGMGYKDLTYEYINGEQNGMRQEIINKAVSYDADTDNFFVYDHMTEDQIAVYNYHYAKNGKEAADKYLDSIRETLNYKAANERFQKMEGKTAQELLFGIEAGADQFQSGVKNLFNTEDDYIAQTATQIASGMVREDLADDGHKLPDWMGGASIGQVGYDAITTTVNMDPSMLTSMVANMIVPGSGAVIGNTMMFASSAGNAYQEALNMGYDKGQARAYSALVGGSEAGLQYLLGGISSMGGKVSGGVLSKMLDGIDNAFARTALKIGGNMLSEGFEEGLQEVLTPLFKNWTLMADEDINWSEVAYSGLLGALTAGFMEGPSTISGEVKTYQTGKQLQAADISATRLAEIGNTFAADTVAHQLAGKVNENTGAYTMGRLFNEIGATMTEQNVSDITNALIAKGMGKETARKNAEAMATVVEGGNLTDLQVAIIESNEVLAEAVRTTIIDPNATWLQRTKGYNEALMALAQETADPKATQTNPVQQSEENANLADSVDVQNESGSENHYEVSVDGKTLDSDGNVVTIRGISSVENGKVVLQTEDGTVDADSVSYGSRGEAQVYEAVSRLEGIIDTETANKLSRHLLKLGDVTTDTYANAIQQAYTYGYYGYGRDAMMGENTLTATLTEKQRNVAYGLGEQYRAVRTEAEQAIVQAKATVAKNTTIGKVHFDGNRNALTERQSASLSAMETVAQALGVQIHVFESQMDKNGKHIGANGWYDPKDGSIHIDLHAGATGEGTMLFTAAHEMTHFIRQWSPAKFKVLADYLMTEYGQKSVSVDALVRKQMAKAKKNGRTIDYDTAYEEVIADSMETMLSDGKVTEKLAKLKLVDKSLWQKIKDFISEMAAKIRKAYDGLSPDSVEGRYVAEMVDSIEKLQELFAEALVEASESFQSAEKNTTDGGVKYSERYLAADVNSEILAMVNKVANGDFKANERVYLGTVSDVIADQINELTGIQVNGFRVAIEARQIDHILKDHGADGDTDHSMADPDDIAKMEYVLGNPDDIRKAGKTQAYTYMRNGKNRTADTVLYEKKIGTKSYYVVQAVPDTKAKTLYIVTAFIGNSGYKKEAPQLINAKGPDATAKTGSVNASVNSIRNDSDNVKNESAEAMDIDVDSEEQVEQADRDLEAEVKYSFRGINQDGIEVYETREEIKKLPYTERQKRFLNIMENDYRGRTAKFIRNGHAYYATFDEKNVNKNIYGDKLSDKKGWKAKINVGADGDIFELVENARYNGSLPEKGKKNTAHRGVGYWDYFIKNVQIDGTVFDLVANVRKKADGAFVYSIQLKENKKIKASPPRGSLLRALNGVTNASTTNVAQSDQNVNLYSDRDLEAVKLSDRENPYYGKTLYKDGEIYAYDFMVALHDMEVHTMPPLSSVKTGNHVDQNKAVQLGLENASDVGRKVSDGLFAIKNAYTGRDILLGKTGLEHGLDGGDVGRLRTNARLSAIGGQIVQNAVPVNGLKNKNRQANGTYAMACLLKSGDRDVVAVVTVEEHTSKAVGIDYVDITHSINGRLRKNNEGSLSSTRETGYGLTAAPNAATFKVSIAEFLKIVNDTHRSILSQNVLDHFDEERPADGHYADRILFSDRDTESVSNRSLLANAFESAAQNDIERNRLQEYKSKIDQINAEEQKLRELKSQIKELSFAKGPRDMKQIRMLRVEATKTANRINIYDNQLLRLEASKPLQDVLKREKKKAYQRAEQMGKEALAEYKRQAESSQQGIAERYRESRKKAVAKARETAEKKYAKAELQKLVIDTAKWISYPAKTDVKCPDLLKQPYANFLNSIDMSSERLSKGGDPTKNDLRLANAMGSLATALERIMSSQDPNQETTEELDAGYLDLPANFVKNLREETEEVMKMMDGDDFVVNNMSAEEVRNLSQMIRTLNHAIREVSTLYANMRFANVEALGNDTMSFMEDIGEIRKTSGMKDFVQWENALPYYAFKRFGKGGEAIFEGLMDAQDKLAFLAQKIFNFQEKTWKGDEAKKWSEDAHTINLPDGEKLTLTTADAMSIYCLSRRQQGLQHLLGGGVRVVGLRKGSQKAQDSRSTLTIKDVDAIISSLTARQKKVAESIQEFMSTTCAEWGNEISMKRFLTREFNEKFYFPIESNDENLSVKDPAAQQSDLFRLLNISATKPIDPKANNEVIIRNIFDVFSSHTSDMARLNAYGLPLLDYMKWLNFREKTVSENGQIKVRGVRKYMETAYGKAAKSYVLNFIKDVNGRPSDHGLPGFYTRMVRNTKTAMVGNSLRVATLQITSYPRAALVLSPKSLALGLTKVPKISRAKKYCGIALWKSFGFYDTNISRSIEDQMKGTHDLRQKMIEWSLKGAEIGDALTWGALWNACEYEVAATKKYKVGSEEFYQAVGKKLREVVYRTQVVDSTLTRSEMMRSKNAKAQELSAFMSEPTLSANILMDAGMEFSLEKRRTDAKTAWKKTGKYVTRAIAVYSIGQLAAALMEGMWDAWRDDDDEEFSEKFADAFTENLILDILPFNKIPIISEMAEGAMSLMGIGYFSSDSLSSTAVSQSVSAVKAWTEVLKGDSSSTAYNALYKTMRAISSLIGVSVSGVMREGVALWNNTAGAYDPTLKILTYDRSKTELGNLLLDAIVNGDSRQADSIKGEFEDKDDYQSTLRGTIKDRYITGDLGRNTAVQYLVNYGGMGKKDAEKRVDEWDFKIKYGENYADLPDLYTSGKIDRDTAVRCLVSYGGMSEKNAKKKVSEWDFKTKYGKTYSELEDEYTNGSVSRNTIMEAMRDSGKKNFEIAEKMRTLDKEIAFTNRFGMTYNELRDSYQNGDTNRKTMYDALVFSGKTASEASDTLTEWDIENRFGIDYGKLDDAYKYGDISRQELYNAMVENGTTHAKAQESILCYNWLKERVNEYPDLEISDARRFVVKIGDNCEDYTLSDYGVSVDTYLEYVKRAKDCSGEDADGDGEIDSNSKAKQLFAMINTLPILDEQKDALAYITNAERTIKKYAPWR